jgi:hypothetical protein
MNEQTVKHLDCLIKDFEVIKSEIARRSNLQRIVLAAYFAVLAFTFQKATQPPLESIWVMVIWVVSFLALQFYCREGLEIVRLSGIIRDKIVPLASMKLGVDTSELFHSETNASNPMTERFTGPYDEQFNWIVFGIAPCLFTVVYASHGVARLTNILDFASLAPWKVVISVVAAVKIVLLLNRHVWPRLGGTVEPE